MGERLVLLTMDEFFFMRPEGFPTMLPLLVNGAALLLTSSMSARADDEMKRMLDAKLPDGREVVMKLDWIRPCHECKMAGIAHKCKHTLQRPQHFQREVDQERVRALMNPFGEGSFDREMLNIGAKAGASPAFQRAWIEPLFDTRNDFRDPLRRDRRVFYVGYDPAGEGFSKNVLLSAFVDATPQPNGAPYVTVVLFPLPPPAAISRNMRCSRATAAACSAGAAVACCSRRSRWRSSSPGTGASAATSSSSSASPVAALRRRRGRGGGMSHAHQRPR